MRKRMQAYQAEKMNIFDDVSLHQGVTLENFDYKKYPQEPTYSNLASRSRRGGGESKGYKNMNIISDYIKR